MPKRMMVTLVPRDGVRTHLTEGVRYYPVIAVKHDEKCITVTFSNGVQHISQRSFYEDTYFVDEYESHQ